jgi:hypothetical protein
VRVLSEVVIYPCINNSYRLIEHARVENAFLLNLTKGLCVRHNFTKSNEVLKP